MVALREISGSAIGTCSARNCRRNDDSIAGLQISDVRSDLFNDAHAFMTENRPGFHARHRAAHHMQVRSANGTGSQPNDCIRSLLDLRIRLFADPDIPQAIEHDGFHWDLSKKV
jgi:hypothetical protein